MTFNRRSDRAPVAAFLVQYETSIQRVDRFYAQRGDTTTCGCEQRIQRHGRTLRPGLAADDQLATRSARLSVTGSAARSTRTRTITRREPPHPPAGQQPRPIRHPSLPDEQHEQPPCSISVCPSSNVIPTTTSSPSSSSPTANAGPAAADARPTSHATSSANLSLPGLERQHA